MNPLWLAGAEIVEIDTTADRFVRLTEKLEKTILGRVKNWRLFILNYPANPTGVTYSRKQMAGIGYCLKKIWSFVICDEVYLEVDLYWRMSLCPFIPEQTIVINGLSQISCHDRLAYGFIFNSIDSPTYQSHPVFGNSCWNYESVCCDQALTEGQDAEPMKKEYVKRRDYIIEKMSRLGLRWLSQMESFYILTSQLDL